MIIQQKTVCVVCFANYCRSPVAEVILKKSCNENVRIISAGLNPIARSGMDKRSHLYLKKRGYNISLHSPRKLSKQVIDNCDEVFAVDPIILMQMNKLFPSRTKKFKMLTFKDPSIILSDPFRFDDKAYNEVMENIEHVCLNLNIKSF